MAFVTPPFSPSDPAVCHSITMRPSIWTAFWYWFQVFGSEYSWRQDDPANATVLQVITEIQQAQDEAIFRGCIMIGTVNMIAREVAPFELLCDGSIYDRVDYPDLYAVIDPIYHVDADTFAVPDMTGRFPRAAVDPGGEGGAVDVTLSTAQLPSHSHSLVDPGTVLVEAGLTASALADPGLPSTTGNTGSGDPVDILPPYHELRFAIVALYPTSGV